MLPNPQMIQETGDAMEDWLHRIHGVISSSRPAKDGEAANLLHRSFDAVDRDELVDAAADALASTGLEHALRERAEIVLRAVGLIT